MHKMLRCPLFTYLLLSLFVVVSNVYAQVPASTDVAGIEGTLLMLDGMTPHVAVVIQAIREGKVMSTVLSDELGKYEFANLKPGTYQVRCHTLDRYLYYSKDKPVDASYAASLQVQEGKILKNIDFRFAPFKKGVWKNYDTLDGLAGNHVGAIHRDPDGTMWFGTDNGVSRYDGKEFVSFTIKGGLTSSSIYAIHRDPDGVMWFATEGGVSRYDGKEFVNFTTKEGLAHNSVRAIHQDPDGVMWFGTEGGVSRYDGKEFVNFTKKDGLANNPVLAIHRDPDGVIWFGTWGGGVSRYDGKEFINFTTKDGLAYNSVLAIHCGPDRVTWFGTQLGGVSRYDGKEFVNLTEEDGLAGYYVNTIHSDPDGVMWFGIGTADSRGLSRYSGNRFVNFTTKDGLANKIVRAIHRDPDGVMWFGTESGVSRYDPKGFINFDTEDGLGYNSVSLAYRDADGMLWFTTRRGGVSRYNGKEIIKLTTEDGLAGNNVGGIDSTPDGVMWFGTWYSGGVSRYDGKEFVNFSKNDGLAGNEIPAIHHSPDGVIWIATWGGGVSRYDGKEFVNFTTKDGLADNYVKAVYCDPDGVVWFGTGGWDKNGGGVSRYDGKEFVNLTTEDGLAHNSVWAIHRDLDGIMWFATSGGVSRYDGKGFVSFTTEDGLAHNLVCSIYRDLDGVLWFGTDSGVSGYDGTAWTSLDARDGLMGHRVHSIVQDLNGFMWFATGDSGVARYHPKTTPPKVYIASVTTDQIYRDLSSIPVFTPGTRVTIKLGSIDLKTVPEKRQYRIRIREIDLDWRRPMKTDSVDLVFDNPGTYNLEVQAIDRDLNYSEPASLTLEVVSPFYMRAAFLVPVLGVGVALLLISIISIVAYTKRRRQVHAYQQLAVQELQDAREMQIALLPESAPPVEGMEIAGRSIPANTVGGDFFDYFTLMDGKVGIAVADVSGKGLRAAMNAVMTSGMLYEVVKTEMHCGRILSELNTGLYPRMEKQMFTAFSFAILDQDSCLIQWSNAGQPFPLIKRSDDVSEAAEGGELPLGMASGVKYPDYELKLQIGNVVIFYTDGIIEAENEAEEMYGTERLITLVAGIDSGAGAEGIIEAILQDVSGFLGDAEQYDDMTIVVVKKL